MTENAKCNKDLYLRNTRDILEASGLFVITSCNWTTEELVVMFRDYFDLYASIPTPTISYGGKTGSMVSAAVFQKK